MVKDFKTFDEFYPFYLGEHKKPLTKLFHFIGTNLMYVIMLTAISTQDIRLVPLGIFVAYFFAWVSHFFIEQNRPATFKYPLWSARADQVMNVDG